MPMLMSQFSPVRIVATYAQAQGSQQERSHCRPLCHLFNIEGSSYRVNKCFSGRAYVLMLMFLLACLHSYAYAYALVKTCLKPQLYDQTFLSNIVFVTRKVRWLNRQTVFVQTSDNGKPFKCKVERGG